MAGRINPEDILAVKERTSLEDIVREHVTLQRRGSSLVGLCPFHDEKTGSFNVNPTNGYFHCYGCGEGGDVISFVSKIEHLSFTEAVEQLATKASITLRYEDGGVRRDDQAGAGRRSRLLEAHRVAEEFYAAYLLEAPEARAGRDFMRARGFNGEVASRFGVGFAPRGFDTLATHLLSKGFTDDEVVSGGLAGRGQRGLYDRFRGRLVWPIRDLTGATIGFGARRVFDDDRIDAKYLNTAETPIYKKSTVLYGIDFARKAIAQSRQAVVVEGYTDVMACHLAGVETAVASCGTAFGVEHIKVLRRLLRDEADQAPARVIFTFDGDRAGQAAAMKAFKDDQKWAAQSFVAVAPDGQDPCELRQSGGDDAVRDLVADAVPMFEFAVRTTIGRFDLDTAEGRVQAMRAAAPILSEIRDPALRPEYTRLVSGWLGMEVEAVAAEVKRAASVPTRPAERVPERHYPEPSESAVEPSDREIADAMPVPDLRDPVVAAERQLLQGILQFPSHVDPLAVLMLATDDLSAPAHRAILAAINAVGLPEGGASARAWHAQIVQACAVAVHPLLADLSVAPLPVVLDTVTGAPSPRYLEALVLRVRQAALARQVADLLGRLRRLDADPDSDPAVRRDLGLQLSELQQHLAVLRQDQEG